MAYWLVKSDPDKYSFEDLKKDGHTVWDGVRNYQARNNLMKMEVGDEVLVYESQSTKYIAGIATVSKSSFPDPTAEGDNNWVAVELKFKREFDMCVSLVTIKDTEYLANIGLIKQSRLSVMPITPEEFEIICILGN
jgi:predicted RNA-binding protein with PUA-like domain